MPYVEHLISAGVIADATPLTRPLKQSDIVRTLTAVDTNVVNTRLRATIRRLLREWETVEHRAHYRVEGSVGAAAATQAVRDPLEVDRGIPLRRRDPRAFGNVGLDGEFLFGSFVGVTHPTVDTRLRYDPDWFATVDNATRFSEAYLSGQWKLGELFFGILDRNLGPSSVQGVLLSDNPYSMDHLALTLGTSGIQLQAIATQLNTLPQDTGSTRAPVNRYMVQNRVWLHPHGRWTLALSAAAVISDVGRQLEPWFLNPASVSYFRAYGGNSNNFLDVDIERHGAATLFGQFMLDDIQVTRHAASDLKPASYALTVGAKGRLRTATATWLV
ncbi:MAG: hypothetical protein DMD28_00825, partial [Gemmatimonadetes bacterium]